MIVLRRSKQGGLASHPVAVNGSRLYALQPVEACHFSKPEAMSSGHSILKHFHLAYGSRPDPQCTPIDHHVGTTAVKELGTVSRPGTVIWGIWKYDLKGENNLLGVRSDTSWQERKEPTATWWLPCGYELIPSCSVFGRKGKTAWNCLTV